MGLLGGIVRTAAVAGVAKAVSNGVSHRRLAAGRRKTRRGTGGLFAAAAWTIPTSRCSSDVTPRRRRRSTRYRRRHSRRRLRHSRPRDRRNALQRSRHRPRRWPAACPFRLDQLRQLGALKAQGVLTDAEFATQKDRILNS